MDVGAFQAFQYLKYTEHLHSGLSIDNYIFPKPDKICPTTQIQNLVLMDLSLELISSVIIP